MNSLKKEPHFSKTIVKSETNHFVQTQKNTNNKVENSIVRNEQNAVAEIQPNNRTISIMGHKNVVPENIDSLLATIEKNKISPVKNSSLTVNSSDLLKQVDGELELSFREKAVKTINQKFKEAKEAVVNRNNQ
jgi:hypothetical protein